MLQLLHAPLLDLFFCARLFRISTTFGCNPLVLIRFFRFLFYYLARILFSFRSHFPST